MGLEVNERDNSEENKKGEAQNLDQTALLIEMRKELNELKAQKSNGNTDSNSDATAEMLKKLVDGLKAKTDDEKYGGENQYVQVADIDPEDYLEVGVPFYCHQVMRVIVDDKRNGHAVQTPFKNTLVFKYQSTRAVGTGKETKLHNLSCYSSHSKKEVKWLEEHTGFGSLFFKSHMEAMTVDAIKANKLARTMISLSRMETGRVVKMAADLGINSEDPSALRIAIANRQVEEEMAKEEAANKIRVKESIIEANLITEE